MPPPRASRGAYDDRALKARVDAIEKTLTAERALTRAARRASVATRPRAVVDEAGIDDGEPVVEEVASLREDVDALLTGAGVESREGTKQITDLVAKLRSEERAARWKRWAGFRSKADAELVATFGSDEGLDETQTQQFTAIISGFREAQMSLRRAVHDGSTSFEEMRSRRKQLRASTHDKLGEVLDEEQLKDFTTKMRERRSHRRGGL